MAQMANPLANTEIPTGAGGITLENEELRQIIERLTPEETPFYSNMKKGTTRAIHTDWGTVTLPPIVVAQAEKRGFEANILPTIPNARLNNYCQLTAQTGSVSDSMDALDLAGRDEESDWQMLLKGQFLKRNVNKLMFANQAKSGVEPTTLGTLASYISGPRFVPLGSGVPGAGDGSSAFTASAVGSAFDSIEPIDDVMEACYDTNGIPKVMYFSPNLKRQFSRIPDASVAENRMNVTPTNAMPVYIGSIMVYWSDFGRLEAVVDRDANDTFFYLVDPEMAEIAALPGRQWKRTMLAKTGSSTKFMMEWEGTLRVWNPTAHGMVEGTMKVTNVLP